MKLLTRYPLREILLGSAVWMGFFFLLLLMLQFLRGSEFLLGSGVTLADLGRLLLYMGPHFLVTVLPLGFLLGLLLGLGRLAEDRELTAMAALGRSPLQQLWAPLVVGWVLSGLLLALVYRGEPWGLTRLRGLVGEVVKKNLIGDVKAGVFYEDLSGLTLYAEEVHTGEGRWENLLIHDTRDPEAPLLVLAREGRVGSSVGSLNLALSEGEVHRAAPEGGDYAVIAYQRGELAVDVAELIFHKNRLSRPEREELTPEELLERAAEEDARGADGLPFRVAFHARWGQALTPLTFALLGAPLAMARRRGGRAWGVLLAIAGYVAYYLIARGGEALGSQGRLWPLLAGQLPNLVLGGLGLLALWRVGRAGVAR